MARTLDYYACIRLQHGLLPSRIGLGAIARETAQGFAGGCQSNHMHVVSQEETTLWVPQ